MKLKDFVLALFREGKKPEELDGLERCTSLEQIEALMESHGSVSLYSVYPISNNVTISRIKEIYPIGSSCLRFEGELESGRYGGFEPDFHLISTRQISADIPHGFIKQKDLKNPDKKNYIKTGLI